VLVKEAETSNDICRHSAQEVHSPQALPGQELEKLATVEAPNGVGTPALARPSVQVVAGPRHARWWAQQKGPEPRVAWFEGTKPTSGATKGTETAGGARGGSGAARGAAEGAGAGGVPEGPAGKGKTETCG
jgi:hypothetical protein